MLQNIRDNSQGWIAKTIIGVIVALMALTGFDAIFKATSHTAEAAKVNGDAITQSELTQAIEMQRRQLMQQLGKDFDPALAPAEDNPLMMAPPAPAPAGKDAAKPDTGAPGASDAAKSGEPKPADKGDAAKDK